MTNLVDRLREALRTRTWVNLPEDIAEAADEIERLRGIIAACPAREYHLGQGPEPPLPTVEELHADELTPNYRVQCACGWMGRTQELNLPTHVYPYHRCPKCNTEFKQVPPLPVKSFGGGHCPHPTEIGKPCPICSPGVRTSGE